MTSKKYMLDLNHPAFTTNFVGFDRLFRELFAQQTLQKSTPSYPPYNLVKDGDTYTIEMAMAGLTDKDIDVVLEDGTLTISYEKNEGESKDVLHQGLANRSFKRSFNLAEDIEVRKATLKNGLLSIVMERIIPEEKKPRTIKISK
jgi:molecular chaperone IbpA